MAEICIRMQISAIIYYEFATANFYYYLYYRLIYTIEGRKALLHNRFHQGCFFVLDAYYSVIG